MTNTMRYIEVDQDQAHYLINLFEDDYMDDTLDEWLSTHQLDSTLTIWLSRRLSAGNRLVASVLPVGAPIPKSDLHHQNQIIAVAPDTTDSESTVEKRTP